MATRLSDFILFSFNRWRIGVVEASRVSPLKTSLCFKILRSFLFSFLFSFISLEIFRPRQFRVTVILPHTSSGVRAEVGLVESAKKKVPEGGGSAYL